MNSKANAYGLVQWLPKPGELVREEYFGNNPGPIGTVIDVEVKDSAVIDHSNVYVSVIWPTKGLRIHASEVLEPVFED